MTESGMSEAGRGSIAMSFLAELSALRSRAVVTARDGDLLQLDQAFGRAARMMEDACGAGRKIVFIGNGGSAAIASHLAVDYWKNGQLTAMAFNDASLLTCISNDFGYERVFAEPIARFAQSGDIVVAISSSGRSPNILAGIDAARARGCAVITCTGFEETNPARRLGDLNFYVPSKAYGIVEVSHLALLHAILDDSMVSRGVAIEVTGR